MQFRLSSVLAPIASVCAFLAMLIAYNNRDTSLTLQAQTAPSLSLSARSDRQTYELNEHEDKFFVRSTFSENYPSPIWPRIEWSFELSNGVASPQWKCDDLVLDWDMRSLSITDGLNAGIPHGIEVYDGFTIEKYWWLSTLEPTHAVQHLHILLIENANRKILAAHRIEIIVDVDVPQGGSE